MKIVKWILPLLLTGAVYMAVAADLKAAIRSDSHNGWILETGGVEYRLRQVDGKVYLVYFGPAGRPDWDAAIAPPALPAQSARYEMAGAAEGESLTPEDLELISQEELHPAGDVDGLQLTYRHRRLPLEIAVQYFTWGDTGVFTRQITVLNKGRKPLAIESLPSLAFELPAGPYDLSYLWGGWGHERQLATEELAAGEKTFTSTTGRSTNGYSPWFCLHNKNFETRFLAQLAYSGNWEMRFTRQPGCPPPARGELASVPGDAP